MQSNLFVGMDFPATPSNASDSNDYAGATPMQFDATQDSNTKRRR